MLSRIYISEIKKELQMKDNRTVNNWCENMGIKIFSDNGTTKKYILKFEYEKVKILQVIDYLIEKYGIENLPEELTSYLKVFTKNHITNKKTQPEYEPQFENEKRLLSIFTNLAPTL